MRTWDRCGAYATLYMYLLFRDVLTLNSDAMPGAILMTASLAVSLATLCNIGIRCLRPSARVWAALALRWAGWWAVWWLVAFIPCLSIVEQYVTCGAGIALAPGLSALAAMFAVVPVCFFDVRQLRPSRTATV
jgi:hypothetical protein